MMTLGIAGTAKNTGKTTTLSAVMTELRRTRPKLRLAITSIGYDGEYLDNVTGLPKPRIELYAGDLAAVAEQCLRYSRARLEILQKTDIMTPMGPILIGRVTTPGKLVVGGPNKRVELRRILGLLDHFGANLTIVDGALGRIVPMSEVDELILATGASRTTDIERLAVETAHITSILSLPQLPIPDGCVQMGPILCAGDYDNLRDVWQTRDALAIRGLIGEPYLKQLADSDSACSGKTLLFENPMSLLLSGEYAHVCSSIDRLRSSGVTLGVTRAVHLVAVTVNPYYPRYRVSNRYYEPAYVDKDALLAAISKSVDAPVYNIKEQPPAFLFSSSQIGR